MFFFSIYQRFTVIPFLLSGNVQTRPFKKLLKAGGAEMCANICRVFSLRSTKRRLKFMAAKMTPKAQIKCQKKNN